MGAAFSLRMAVARLVWLVCLWASPGLQSSETFSSHATAPILAPETVSIALSLEHPPVSVAVAAGTGDIFFTSNLVGAPSPADPHSEAPKVSRHRGGKSAVYPNDQFAYVTPSSLKIDSRDQLWVLDHGEMGQHSAALFCFDTTTNQLIHSHKFPKLVAPRGSMLSELTVSPDRQFVFIADSSITEQAPAIVVFKVATGQSWRVLEGDSSVSGPTGRTATHVNGVAVGFPWKVNVNSVAVSSDGLWLYFGAMHSTALYRAPLYALTGEYNTTIAASHFADKPASNGITVYKGKILISDINNSGIAMIDEQTKHMVTLCTDKELFRWPAHITVADGHAYVAASAVHELTTGLASAPYHIISIDLFELDDMEEDEVEL